MVRLMAITTLARLAVVSAVAVLSIGTAAAQRCDGVELAVGAKQRRCLVPGAGERFKDCAACPQMVVVPAGSFTMGSPPGEPERAAEREDEVRVAIARPFAIGAFAVTRGEFAAFVKATGHKPDQSCYFWTGTTWEERADRSWQSPGFAQANHHPVLCVALADAKAYAAWLSSRTGKTYRLPSEAEREYATRAGTTTPFWWGATISTEQASYDGTHAYAGGAKGEWRQRTLPVDSFRPNPWGLYTCTATSGSGSRIAGPRRTPATPETAAPGPAATAAGAWCAAAPGTTRRPTCAPPSATGTCRTTAAACRGFGWLGGFDVVGVLADSTGSRIFRLPRNSGMTTLTSSDWHTSRRARRGRRRRRRCRS